MDQPDAEQLRSVLRQVVAPGTGRDIVSAGLVEGLQVRDGLVHVALLADRDRASAMEKLRQEVTTVLARVPGVLNVTAVLTAHRGARQPREAGSAAASPAAGAAPPPPASPQRSGPATAKLLPEVRAIIAVASGKGGVGKSTTAVNLAVALARQGLRTGLLDADVYGPSLPRMLGRAQRPELRGQTMIPIEAWGLKAMSIGFLVDEDTAMIWRGPMVMGALEQMMGQVDWGALDVLVVDMPPGTGDAQLTMAQRVALTGAVVVSTPQDIALQDARRGVAMFEKTRVPVLGIVENMSYFCCPNCNHRAEVFGHGGARAEAARLGVEFLAEIPLLLDIRSHADAGTPIVAAAPESAAAQTYAALAARVWEKAEARLRELASSAPRFVVE